MLKNREDFDPETLESLLNSTSRFRTYALEEMGAIRIAQDQVEVAEIDSSKLAKIRKAFVEIYGDSAFDMSIGIQVNANKTYYSDIPLEIIDSDLPLSKLREYKVYSGKKKASAQIKTYSGAVIKRSKHGVGKDIGGSIYLHRNYAEDVIPSDILTKAKSLLAGKFPKFRYNILVFSPKVGLLRFDEAPDFDSAREPIPGDTVVVDYANNKVGEIWRYDSIWHHKWLFVKDDYSGFNVEESKQWSRLWTSKLQETAKGRKHIWEKQLAQVGLK